MRIIYKEKNDGSLKRVDRADKLERRKARRQKEERTRWALNNAFNGSF
jgi:hypothetical protein